MTLDYLAAARGLRTQNQFNRLHIDLGRIITPLEFSDLVAQDRDGKLPSQAGSWLHHLQHSSPTLANAPQPYVATTISERMTWYSIPQEKRYISTMLTQRLTQSDSRGLNVGIKSQKPVLIAFCGMANRIMLPLPIVLQALPAFEWDILKITRTPNGGYFRPGSETKDMEDLMIEIRRVLDRMDRSDITCIGTSGGGSPALLAALRLNARRCISICGNLSDACIPIISELSGQPIRSEDPHNGSSPEILYLHGEHHDTDRKNAQKMRSFFNGKIMSIPNVSGHNPLNTILKQGRFNSEFNALMHGSLNLSEKWNGRDA